MTTNAEVTLSVAEEHALFDILTHCETYREVQDVRYPETLAKFGYPFVRVLADGKRTHAAESTAPILQRLLNAFVLKLPGLKDLSAPFWSIRFQGILENFANANLSESYDKGAISTRRTLSTVISSVLELVARGQLGGYQKQTRTTGYLEATHYDLDCAQSLVEAWDDTVDEMLYGDLINDLFDHVSTVSGNPEDYAPATAAAVRYVILHLAAIIHQILVVSSEGPYMVKLMENLQKMLPWGIIRQTMRIGNAATMVNALVRLLLAKLSIGSISNWLGMTTDAEDGTNMLQRIVSMILSWDSADFKKKVVRIQKSKNGPSKMQLAAIDEHLGLPRQEQDRVRADSIAKGQSIVVAILENQAAALPTSEEEHGALLEYYSSRLSIRDREEISRVLCRSKPDLPTQALRELVGAFEPILRQAHEKLPLHEAISDVETFIVELIDTAKGAGVNTPTVTDFMELLMRNRFRLYKWLHRLLKQCPGPSEELREWANNAIREFRASSTPNGASVLEADAGLPANYRVYKGQDKGVYRVDAAGAMTPALSSTFAMLPENIKTRVKQQLGDHATYLEALAAHSVRQMQVILDRVKTSKTVSRKSSPDASARASIDSGASLGMDTIGPGIYLMRWRDLLDETLLTPEKPSGRPRRAKELRQRANPKKTAIDNKGNDNMNSEAPVESLKALRLEVAGTEIEGPDVSVVFQALGGEFRKLLAAQVALQQAVEPHHVYSA